MSTQFMGTRPTASNTSTRVALYIDPPSHHFLHDRLFVVEDGRANGDRILAPYAHLRAALQEQGIPVHTADLLPPESATTGTTNVYVSFGMLGRYKQLSQRRDTVLSAYFAFECPVVEPSQYRALPDVQRRFRHLFSWSDAVSLEPFTGARVICEPFRWPQSFDDVHESIWQQTDRKFLVLITHHRLPRLYVNQLYTERFRAVEFFARTGEIDLYGPDWDRPAYRVGRTRGPYTLRRLQRAALAWWHQYRLPSYLAAARGAWKGITPSKAETLGRYTFAICFENMILKGWVTEKIFDCFFAGTVPIYWGAPEIGEIIPPECFIDMRQFSDYVELRRYLKALRPAEIQRYRESARDFLHSPAFQPFSKAMFTQRICQLVDEAATGRSPDNTEQTAAEARNGHGQHFLD